MKISGSFILPIPQQRAYEIMQDPGILAQAMPGCEALEKIGEDEYRMKMKMALASLSGAFDGRIRITDQSPPDSFRLIVEGSGRIGFMKGDGLLKLTPVKSNDESPATEVSYDGDAQVGGTMAAVGQRLIDGTAKMLIKRFFEKLIEIAQ
jgi:carbon monoxide dehydrogenase subunit G